jgi:hypothetical protein
LPHRSRPAFDRIGEQVKKTASFIASICIDFEKVAVLLAVLLGSLASITRGGSAAFGSNIGAARRG